MKAQAYLDTYTETTEANIEKFPEGETLVNLAELDIQEKEVEFEPGKKKMRWILSFGDKKYWAGRKVLDGLKEAVSKGAKAAKVMRQGQGMKTSYMVLPVL